MLLAAAPDLLLAPIWRRRHCFALADVDGRVDSRRGVSAPRDSDGSHESLFTVTKADGEFRELEREDLKRLRGASSLPAGLQRMPSDRGLQQAPTKERIAIRLSRDVDERCGATGHCRQMRVDAELQDGLKKHEPAA